MFQQNLSTYYKFRSIASLCEKLNQFTNILWKEVQESINHYPLLAEDHPKKTNKMTGREILGKLVNLEDS